MNEFKKYDTHGAYHYEMLDDPFCGAKILKALAFVDFGMKVLDVGCGDGVFLKYADLKGAITHGIDSSSSGIWWARKKTGCENLYVGSTDALPFPDDMFDLVVMIDVINYLNDYAGAIREACRVLVAGGKLAIMSPWKVDLIKERKDIPDSWQSQVVGVDNLRGIIEDLNMTVLVDYIWRSDLKWCLFDRVLEFIVMGVK